MFLPIDGWTLILKKLLEKKAFLIKPKVSMSLSQWEECVYSAQPLKEGRSWHVSMFVPINERTLILSKMVGRKAFLMKPMYHFHLSEWGEYVYAAQSRIKKRLLHVSMFVLINEWTLIFGKIIEKKLCLWNQSIIVIYPNDENLFIVLNHKKN